MFSSKLKKYLHLIFEERILVADAIGGPKRISLTLLSDADEFDQAAAAEIFSRYGAPSYLVDRSLQELASNGASVIFLRMAPSPDRLNDELNPLGIKAGLLPNVSITLPETLDISERLSKAEPPKPKSRRKLFFLAGAAALTSAASIFLVASSESKRSSPSLSRLAQTEFNQVPAPSVSFSNIDGGFHHLDDWRGGPVLLINAASRCGYTQQYTQMQEMHETYADRGLVVLALPSDDFRQELDSAAEVKEYCELQFGITLPMTDITQVLGGNAHPFYAWMRDTHGWEPSWNFNKVLIGADGMVKGAWRSQVLPNDPDILDLIEAELVD